ncbi:MAG: hypothetical protein RIR04_1276 [Pseudomonadota bacterium]
MPVSSGVLAQASLKTSQEVAARNGDNKSKAWSDQGSCPQGWGPLSFWGKVGFSNWQATRFRAVIDARCGDR